MAGTMATPPSIKFLYNPKTHAVVLYDRCPNKISYSSLSVDNLQLLDAIEKTGTLVSECVLVARTAIKHLNIGYWAVSVDYTSWLLHNMDNIAFNSTQPVDNLNCWKALRGARAQVCKVLPSVEVVLRIDEVEERYMLFDDFSDYGNLKFKYNLEKAKQGILNSMCEFGCTLSNDQWIASYIPSIDGDKFHLCSGDNFLVSENELGVDFLDFEETLHIKTRKTCKSRKARRTFKPSTSS